MINLKKDVIDKRLFAIRKVTGHNLILKIARELKAQSTQAYVTSELGVV